MAKLTFQKRIYNLIKHYRFNNITKLLDNNSNNILDIGCQEAMLYDKLKDKYHITLADISPTKKLINKEDVQNLSFKDNSFDIVICQEVLEHVPNPIKAISELKRVAKKQLIISVPYEPFFTMARLFIWEKEHLWAITPKIFEFYLGKPVKEKTIFFKRYYVGVWTFKK